MRKIYLFLSLMVLSYGAKSQGLLGNFEFNLLDADAVIPCDGSDYNLVFSVTYTGPDPVEGGILYYWIPNIHYEEGAGIEAMSSYMFSPGDEIGTFGAHFTSEEVETLFNLEDTTLNYGPYTEGQKYLSFIEFWDPMIELYDIFFYEVIWCGDIHTSVDEAQTNRTGLNIYPNPAIQNFNVSIDLNRASEVVISLIDINGRVLKEWMPGILAQGGHHISVDTRDIPEGMYILQVSIIDDTSRERLIIKK